MIYHNILQYAILYQGLGLQQMQGACLTRTASDVRTSLPKTYLWLAANDGIRNKMEITIMVDVGVGFKGKRKLL